MRESEGIFGFFLLYYLASSPPSRSRCVWLENPSLHRSCDLRLRPATPTTSPRPATPTTTPTTSCDLVCAAPRRCHLAWGEEDVRWGVWLFFFCCFFCVWHCDCDFWCDEEDGRFLCCCFFLVCDCEREIVCQLTKQLVDFFGVWLWKRNVAVFLFGCMKEKLYANVLVDFFFFFFEKYYMNYEWKIVCQLTEQLT